MMMVNIVMMIMVLSLKLKGPISQKGQHANG